MSSKSQKPNPKIPVSLVKTLSTSNFTIFLAESTNNRSNKYAMKIFPYAGKDIHSSFKNELRAFSFSHPNIVNYKSYDRKIQMSSCGQSVGFGSYILMELAPYGDAADLIVQKKMKGDDKLVRTFFHHLVEGVEYIHSKGYAHGDLKLDNVLLGHDYIPKINDFESMVSIVDREKFDGLGTVNYRAPEIISGTCRSPLKVDIYSLGIMLIVLQLGEFAYNEKIPYRGADLFEMLIESNPDYWKFHRSGAKIPKHFGFEFMDLVFRMTKKNPEERITLKQVKENAWYNGPIYTNFEFTEKMNEIDF